MTSYEFAHTIAKGLKIVRNIYGPFLLKLLVTVKIMCKKKVFQNLKNFVKAVQVNISNAMHT